MKNNNKKKQQQQFSSINNTLSHQNISARVPKSSISEPLHILVLINNLSDNLSFTPKLFADETSVFSIVHDIN